MRCPVCQKNPATVHLTQVVDGKSRTVDLCEQCAKQKGIADPAGFALADLLLAFEPAKTARRRGPKPGQDSPPGPTA